MHSSPFYSHNTCSLERQESFAVLIKKLSSVLQNFLYNMRIFQKNNWILNTFEHVFLKYQDKVLFIFPPVIAVHFFNKQRRKDSNEEFYSENFKLFILLQKIWVLVTNWNVRFMPYGTIKKWVKNEKSVLLYFLSLNLDCFYSYLITNFY